MLPRADIVALPCPLTEETRNLIEADALSRMKALGLSRQRRARALRRGGGAGPRIGRWRHRRRWYRCDVRGAAQPIVSFVGTAERFDYAAYRGRDAPL